MLCGLRMIRGVDLVSVRRQSGLDPLVHYREEIARLEQRRLVIVEGGSLRASEEGLTVLDQVAMAFV